MNTLKSIIQRLMLKKIVMTNCIEIIDKSVSEEKRSEIRKKYNIPLDKKVFLYMVEIWENLRNRFLIKVHIWAGA